MADNSFIRPVRIPGKRMVLTKSMIEESQKHTKSNMEAARWLKVSYNTYKKWAKYYNLFDQHLNQSGIGTKKGWASYRISLTDIFDGKRKSRYTLAMLRKRMVDEGYAKDECYECAFNESRVTDGQIPLRIDFIDGDPENKSLENMRFLCANCYFVFNGFFYNSKRFIIRDNVRKK
tara:strand:+ start:189 stop:716 length:528 start_codon:yes stop_codon:yes gene_type:complete